MAVLERLLNFAHTGSAKVLTTGLMNRLWASRALKDGCMPMFSDVLSFGGPTNTLPTVPLSLWPYNRITKMPYLASKRAQELTYGEDHFLVRLGDSAPSHPPAKTGSLQGYLSNFQMLLALEQGQHVGQPLLTTQDQLLAVCRIAIDAYIEDVRTLVKNALAADNAITPTDKSDPDRIWMVSRMKNFDLWNKLDHPLAWGESTTDAYWLLSLIVYRERGAYGEGLRHSVTETCSPRMFVDKLYASATATTLNGVRTPLLSRGRAWAVFRTAIAQCLFRISPCATLADMEAQIKFALEACVREAQINFYPDLGEPRQRDPSPLAWTLIGRPNSARHRLNEDQPMSHDQRMELNLVRTARAVRASDANAPWSAKSTSINEYHRFLMAQSLPVDFDIAPAESGTTDPFTVNAYQWAKGLLTNSPQDWRCRLARHLAFLISKMTPNVFPPSQIPAEIRLSLKNWGNRNPSDSISLVRRLPWLSRPKIKGLSPSIYFSQAAVVFLCWIHEDSPLRRSFSLGNEDLSAWHHKSS